MEPRVNCMICILILPLTNEVKSYPGRCLGLLMPAWDLESWKEHVPIITHTHKIQIQKVMNNLERFITPLELTRELKLQGTLLIGNLRKDRYLWGESGHQHLFIQGKCSQILGRIQTKMFRKLIQAKYGLMGECRSLRGYRHEGTLCLLTGSLPLAAVQWLSPLDCKEIKPVSPKGNQSWVFIRRTDAEAPIL